MTYSAVITTGIYCRPGCAARPNPENVRTFELAAAAEASGFRACLRCRPYRTEGPVPRSAPELVCRAVRLIVDGALDGATEIDLCRRLGVSGRHLRRLFTEHVGVTPDQLARSRRTHFARRLLDDTDLSVTDIAYASGFGSVRQFNRACQDIFQASPRELRERRRRADRLAADGGLVLRLPFSGPLDWSAMIAFLAARAIPGVECVDGSTYRRTVVIGGDPGVIELEPGGSGEMILRAHLPHWEGLIHLVQHVRDVASLDAPHEEAIAVLAEDLHLRRMIAAEPGLRVPGTWDPFEIGIRVIVGQQVSVAGASTIAGRLVQRLGRQVDGLQPLGLTHVFPPPAEVATGNLDGVGLTAARVRAVRTFARAVAGGALVLDRSRPLDELIATVGALPGIGPWTAHHIALRMGVPDAFPASDLGLRKAMAAIGVTEPDAWRPWRATAAMLLWSSLTKDVAV